MTPRLRSLLPLPLLLLLLLLPLAAHGAGLYRAGSDVVKLTDANFEVCMDACMIVVLALSASLNGGVRNRSIGMGFGTPDTIN